jgi:hypothetical protein
MDGKSLLHPVATHHPQLMRMDVFLPPELSSCNASPPTYENGCVFTPELSRTGQNHKMKIQFVLDFKLVVLCSEHTIWDALVHIFFITLDLCFSL